MSATIQNYFRDYDPATGRYVESDPIGLTGGSYSTYVYGNGNPLSNSDPDGLAANSFPQPPQPLPATSAQACSDDKQHCEELLRIDTDTCNAIAKRRGKVAGEACHSSATERYAACLPTFPVIPIPAPVPILPPFIEPMPIPIFP